MQTLVNFLYFALFPITGIMVACIGFCDPDTCWHLACGRWIFEHGRLPASDPFSSNLGSFVQLGAGLPLVQHEWLSDLSFFGIYKVGGYTGLLVICTLASLTSLLVLPRKIMARNQVPATLAMTLSMAILLASAFRLWVRPECLSFLLFALLIFCHEQCLRGSLKSTGIFAAAIAAIMALWANLHGLFLIGPAFLIAYFLISLALCSSSSGRNKTAWQRSGICVIAALLGTLATPWTYRLHPYVLNLILSPLTAMNKENTGMHWNEISSPTFPPLVFAFLIFGIAFFRRYRLAERSQLLLSVSLSLAALALVLLLRRLTPFALLLLVVATARLFDRDDSSTGHNSTEKNNKYDSIATTLSLAAGMLSCAFASGVLLHPTLPSPSKLFKPPFQAIAFLQKHQPSGRMLNDSKYGSMMEWLMSPAPDVFIDGRFDSYDRQLVYDYYSMRFARNNWDQVLNRYAIDWVFFPSKSEIVSELSKRSDWSCFYDDGLASILTRKK